MRLRAAVKHSLSDPVPDGWIFVALMALLAWLPLPWASNPAWSRALLVALAAGLVLARLALLLFRGASLPDLPWPGRLALRLWLAWLAWLALQLVPLPKALLQVLSPEAFEVHQALAALPGAEAAFTISILPGATLDQWLLSAALFALFWLVLVSVARNRGRQRTVLLVLVLSGLAQALYAIVMTLSGWEFGFFGPKAHNVGYTTGTFVNKNHLASYLGLCLSAGVALVLADLKPGRWQSWRDAASDLIELALSPRFRVRVMLAVIVIALVLTRSRMGNVAFFVALGACGSLFVLLRHRRYFVPGLALFASIFLVDLWIVSDRYGLEKLAERIEKTDVEQEGRSAVFADIVPLARQYWVTGSGIGTFGAAFSPARSDDIRVWYDHAHNDHLQFFIETGLLGYLLLCGLAGLVLWHGLLLMRRRHDPVPSALGFAAVMGTLYVSVHAHVDFILQIPAVAGTLVTLMALALSSSTVPSQQRPNG